MTIMITPCPPERETGVLSNNFAEWSSIEEISIQLPGDIQRRNVLCLPWSNDHGCERNGWSLKAGGFC
ncbi:hypothetical protein MOQ95_004851 [Salmonella enterica]|nr:hypothetical protein [Salmonella enterica]